MKQLTIGNKTFANRFFLGTGKFASSGQTKGALAARSAGVPRPDRPDGG